MQRKMKTPQCMYHIKFKEVFPLFWKKCDECGAEIKCEKMYYCIYPMGSKLIMWRYIYGCTKCFNNMDEFKQKVDEEMSKPVAIFQLL